jgi:hypothetical protein
MQINVRVIKPNYVRVKNSLELYGMDRRSWHEGDGGDAGFDSNVDSIPDVFRHNPSETGGKPDFVFMTEDIQHWIFRLNVERVLGYRFESETAYRAFWKTELIRFQQKDPLRPATFITWFNQLFKGDRSHTNFAGVNEYANYIADLNMGTSLPKFSNIVTGDFVTELNDPTATKYIQGVVCRPLKCINISKNNYRSYHPLTHPALFDQPTVSGRDLEYTKEGWVKTAFWMRTFHHFNVRVIVPFMLPQDSVTWMPASGLAPGGIPLTKPFGQYSKIPL